MRQKCLATRRDHYINAINLSRFVQFNKLRYYKYFYSIVKFNIQYFRRRKKLRLIEIQFKFIKSINSNLNNFINM